MKSSTSACQSCFSVTRTPFAVGHAEAFGPTQGLQTLQDVVDMAGRIGVAANRGVWGMGAQHQQPATGTRINRQHAAFILQQHGGSVRCAAQRTRAMDSGVSLYCSEPLKP